MELELKVDDDSNELELTVLDEWLVVQGVELEL